MKIGGVNFTFVFRHKWEKKEKYSTLSEFKKYELGLWFRINKIVGRKNFTDPKKWSDNLVNDYMMGINLIICKVWVSFHKGGMSMSIK